MPQEPDVNSRGRKTWRIVLLCVIAAYYLLLIIGSSRWLYSTIGDLGLVADSDGRLLAVDPKGAAADAGLHEGDRIDLKSASASQRYFLWNTRSLSLTVAPGMRVAFPVVRPARPRLVTLTSKPLDISASDKAIAITVDFAFLALLLLGTVVVLQRPSLMAWGFYSFALFVAPSIPYAGLFIGSLPVGWGIVDGVTGGLQLALVHVVPLLFALRFPRDVPEGWRRVVERFVPLLLTLYFAVYLAAYTAYIFFGVGAQGLFSLLGYFLFGIEAVAICALASTYLGTSGADRQRIKWAFLGLVVGLGGSAILYSGFFPTFPPTLFRILELLNILAPIAAAYAILRRRIIDINFVVSRALVYGVLTAFVVAVFALIDWLFISVFANARFGLIAEVTAAVAIGFWLNGLHVRIDRLIDTVFFRERHKAEQRLARVAASLPHAVDADAVDDMLVAEPVAALRLASGALFKRDERGYYAVEAAVGWPDGSCKELPQGDALVLQLSAEQGPLRLSDMHWPHTDLPKGAAEPLIALPIIVRRSLAGILLYGAHEDATDIDPDEVKVLAGLAVSAAAAYDHIEAETLRRENGALKDEFNAWKVRAKAAGLDLDAAPAPG